MSRFNSRQWLAISAPGTSFACPEMRLVGRWGDALVVGSGRILLDRIGNFQFELQGEAANLELLKEFLSEQRRDPYNGQARFRLVVSDEDGQEMHCGFVSPSGFNLSVANAQNCSGEVEGLSLDAPSFGDIGSEILMLVPEQHWFAPALAESFNLGADDEVGRHSVDLLGSALEFEFEQRSRTLTISITNSDTFPQGCTEWWLSEPLRMMLGQLVFPRVTVRSNADRAIVQISQMRNFHGEADHYSLYDPTTALWNPGLFFEMYAEILEFVATSRSEDAGKNLGRHALTELYEELAQAMRGSRWIMTLMLASAIEGALKLLFPTGAKDPRANLDELEDLRKHMDQWDGHATSTPDSVAFLKGRAQDAVSSTADFTAMKRLRFLEGQAKIASEEVKAWRDVRNKVAHGTIFSPFSTKDNDRLVLNLMSLFRKLAGLIALRK